MSGKEHTQTESRDRIAEKQRKKREKQAKNVTFQQNLATAQVVQIRKLVAFERIDSA